MASETDICNLALTRIGNNPITSIDQADKPGTLCKLHYPICRDTVLMAHPWNFAIKRTVLPKELVPPTHEFSAQHTIPADCLRIMRTGFEAAGMPIIYRIEGNKLLCNDDQVYVEYITSDVPTGRFSPLFVDALACKLAAEIAISITGSDSKAQSMMQMYVAKIQEARVTDAMEGTPRDIVDTSGWFNARGGFAGHYTHSGYSYE
jgi:hypothetical protein